ncbi:related to Sucrose-6-phosphate hydrolase [Sporisorium reilianum f. sp. reilianum]|uniref:Related to Sucrose-6-phosphate hydrolase n=1 Tax=Sporisorium reilianum f. sp. reilianum TaxID=72559 RepID=A0A2N8UG79_9BASI|nr:related to Sucrose-6-phosphate hydrolase [Sporisorium reilianum f. sp. reilianum]
MSPVSTKDPLASLDEQSHSIDPAQKLSAQKSLLYQDLCSAQLSLPQSLSHSNSSHPSVASAGSNPSSPTTSASPTAFPTSTPASSGISSPLEELRESDMLKLIATATDSSSSHPQQSSTLLFSQWRPTSHFLGPHGWMNDPCGPSYDPRTGLYHLWYQWNPTASTWGNISWGHAYSRDLVHWTSRPQPVLSPGSNHDSQGVFTGCVLQRSPLGTPEEAVQSADMTALYTAVSKLPIHHTLPYSYGCEKVVLSTSADGGETWIPQGIVVDGPPKHLDVISWRDPYIAPWPLLDTLLGRTGEAPGLYALIAGGIKDTTPTTFAYSIDPTDLSQWSYVGTLADVGRNCKAEPYGVDLGQNWEVANFFTIADEAGGSSASAEYLLINVEGCIAPGPARAPVYMKLDLDATQIDDGEIRLQPAHVGLLDHGCLYAASSFHDDKHHRRLMWGWITEDDLPEDYYDTQGWAGLISLPRELFHHPTSSELGIRPAEEVRLLRQGAQEISFRPEGSVVGAAAVELAEAAMGDAVELCAVPVAEVASRSFEVEMELSAAQPGLVVAHSEDLSTRTLVYVSASGELVVDRSLSAGKDSAVAKQIKVNTSTLRAPLTANPSGTHKLRLFMDNSVLEIFVDDLVALSTRVYPDAQDTGLSVLVRPDAGAAGEVRIWQGLDKALVA